MAISMTKLQEKAPELVDMRKQVNISLEKAGIADTTAKVALCIDHSGSMRGMFSDGTVQAVAEKILVLASAFDDDGDIDVFSFGSSANNLGTLDLSNYKGGIDRLFKHEAWGSTNYAAAIETVRRHYVDEGSKFPAYVLFLTDGAPDSESAANEQLRQSRDSAIFWQFVGISEDSRPRFPYLGALRVPHAGFLPISASATVRRGLFHRATAGRELSLADDQLYDQLLQSGYSRWLTSRR